MERKLKYTCGTGDADYFITDGTTTIYLDGCVIFESVFPLEEFDEIVSNCRANDGVGTEEFEGFELIDNYTDTSDWSPLFESYEEYDEWCEQE